MRIGLISDTHISKRGELWPQVFDAFDGVDAIWHAGDVWSPALLDELEAIAPVRVARGNGDFGQIDPRLEDQCVMTLDGVTVAMLHDFPTPAHRPAGLILDRVGQRFPDISPDVVVYGHTHIEAIDAVNGLLFVNPGSPTLPHNKSLRLGTIGFLNLANGVLDAELRQLTADGTERIRS
ncbi:MAG: metallophosphoesterase family protein [Gammaproteobacteria bacterium]|nr:metallophosphoesterase family protein [Gammaproteobacteria bacterium]MYF27484.1 metallophosphoesterase family protein [Gammaproteobacteria bacterium]MYK46457.1 metallophosphoesterase family protein [Gammaproteobacteria bacterium]